MADTRMRRRDFIRASAAAGAMAAVPAGAWAQGAQPKRGGTLKQVGFEPPTFDIHGSVSFQTQLISSFVHRTLFKYVNGAKYAPSDYTLSPDLASSAAASKDGKMYTITLAAPMFTYKYQPNVRGMLGTYPPVGGGHVEPYRQAEHVWFA